MKNLILCALVLMSSLAFSQFKTNVYSWENYNGTYSVANIVENGDNFQIYRIETVSVDMLKARKREEFAAILTSKGLKSCNYIDVIEVTKDGKTQLSRNSYWMLPGNTEINPESKSGQFYSEIEISRKFPKIFQSEGLTKYSYDNQRIKTFDFDTYYQQYFVTSSNLISCDHPTRKDKVASNAISNSSFDASANLVIAVYPAEKNEEDKYFGFKNYEIIQSSPICKVINQVKVSFNFPRTYKEQKTVYDINDPKKSIGQLLIFERLNAGKLADPNKENVQVVYCSNKGETVSALINFRPDNKGWEKIHGVFGDGENIFISYHSYGADGSFFGMKKISKSGESQDYKYTEEQLKANTVIPTGNLGQMNTTRKELGSLYNKPAFRWGIEEFKLQGVQKTSSKLYIWGQAIYKVSDPNFKGEGMPPTISYYAEGFVFVYNNTNMAFEKMFMLNLPSNKVESIFKVIALENDKLEFFIPVQAKEHKDYSKTAVTKNQKGADRYGDYNRMINPLFMTINGLEGKFQFYLDVNTLNLDNGLVTCKDGSRYVVGFDAYAGEGRDDSGEFAYRINHYLHIIPVTY